MGDESVEIMGGQPGTSGRYLAVLRSVATGRYLAPVSPDPAVPEAWGRGITGLGVKCAIVDTGLWEAHPLIAAQLTDADRVDFTGEGLDDGNGHGTLVALILLATAPDTTLISVKALNSRGQGTKPALIEAIEWTRGSPASLVTVSAGRYNASCRGDCDVCQAAARLANSGKVLFAAAGNRPGTTACPAKRAVTHPGEGVAVAAYDFREGRIAAYSGIGTHAGDLYDYPIRELA